MNHILFLENICMAQFRITPNIGIQVLLHETILYFLSILTLDQPWNGSGKVTHMDRISKIG